MRPGRTSRHVARAVDTVARSLHRLADRLSTGRGGVGPATEERLNALFVALFDRPIDEIALKDLGSRHEQGMPFDEIALHLAASDEYFHRVVHLQVGAELEQERLARIYRTLLGRDLDDPGRRHYDALLAQGMPFDDVVLDLAQSDEYQNRVLREHIGITDLRTVAPERFADVKPLDGGAPEQLLRVATPADFDWLEHQIAEHGYYERPGAWGLGPTTEKRVMAEVIAGLAGTGASVLELGCANGVVLDELVGLGVDAFGVEISETVLRRASDVARPRIHVGELGTVDIDDEFDVVVALDILEHLNPNRLKTYLDRIRRWVRPGGFLLANLPVFGSDPIFGEVFPMRFAQWQADADAGRLFSLMQLEEEGWPRHGHLIWADSSWWQSRFAAAGFSREPDIERAFHARYREYLSEVAPARLSLFVLSRSREPASIQRAIDRVRAGRAPHDL